MNGIINAYKPVGMTSHDVVKFIRKELKIKKVGHIGTLDPEAEGVLPLCINNATKFSSFLMDHNKKYRAEITFGFSTDTLDKTGSITDVGKLKQLKKEMIISILQGFKGKIKQYPPIYSAKKVKGKKLYEYARAGIEIEIPPINVEIYKIDLVSIILPYKILIDVECSKGTYIRSLVRDICAKMDTTGYMSMLIRTQVGPFNINDAQTLDDIIKYGPKLYDVDYGLEMESIKLDYEDSLKISHGQLIQNKYTPFIGYVKIYDYQNLFLGVGISDENKIKPKRMISRGN
ncbi:MAG: tRNA pseudouridine(55) synthase TruB [Thermoanaerobacteraceae bacterium]